MKASVQGQSFVRTKSGNLVALEYVKRKELEARKKRLLRHVNTIKQIHQARRYGRASTSCCAWINYLSQYWQQIDIYGALSLLSENGCATSETDEVSRFNGMCLPVRAIRPW